MRFMQPHTTESLPPTRNFKTVMNRMSRLTTSCLRRCLNPSTARHLYSTQAQAPFGKVVDLPDGRRLEYHERSDPEGVPIIFIHGTPDSGATLGTLEDTIGKEMGVRWIGPNRSGIGASTFYPNRRVLDYPRDVRALTEHLQLERY